MGTEKIITRSQIGRIAQKRLVFTNGCFDFLHLGHVHCLAEAKKHGAKLLVAVNSDDSIRRIKHHDPLFPQDVRAEMLSHLEMVDYVCIFDEDNVSSLLSELQPSVFVKGGDYTLETLNQDEKKIVLSYGGKILLVPTLPGYSTGEMIKRIQRITLV